MVVLFLRNLDAVFHYFPIFCLSFKNMTYILGDFPDTSAGKESTYNTGYLGSIPGLGRFPGEGKGYPLWYSGLENFMDCIIHVVAKSQT